MLELIEGYNQVVKDVKKSRQYVENIFNKLGLETTAKIDYKCKSYKVL